jgi:putative phage-type endonuclease
MKKNLIQVSTKEMTEDQWLEFRERGLGASDTGTVLGLNPYKSVVELFYEKVGLKPISREESPSMFWGTEMEALVADKWQYWDHAEPSQEAMIKNVRAEKIIRKCERVNRYISNPEFPHLFVSLDRRILIHDDRGEGALEVKTMNGYVADKWESGIPPMYLVQLQTQLLVCDFSWGEMAVLVDGRAMDVYQFEANESIQASIIEKTSTFWKSVVEARALVNLMESEKAQGNTGMAEYYMGQIDALAPDPDGSVAYEDYIKEKFKTPTQGTTLQGTQADYDTARSYDEVSDRITVLEEEKRLYSNTLKTALGDFETLDFGKNGKTTWKANVKGTRVFKVSLK